MQNQVQNQVQVFSKTGRETNEQNAGKSGQKRTSVTNKKKKEKKFIYGETRTMRKSYYNVWAAKVNVQAKVRVSVDEVASGGDIRQSSQTGFG